MNILIFSELCDASTSDVIDWLSNLGHTTYRINAEDNVCNLKVAINNQSINVSVELKDTYIDLNDIDNVWYRRGKLSINYEVSFSKDINNKVCNSIYSHLFDEELTLKEFIYYYLYDKPHLGDNSEIKFNKLISLKKAKEVGLKIPDSEIDSKKEDLINFFNLHNNDCISKGVQDILSFTINNKGYHYTTSKIEREDIQEMGTTFFPSLLQENIEKKYELRIFYLKGSFYPMAIFSQNDEQTKIDFRNYNNEKPNRNVPFILPKKIEKKLETFMQSMELDTGSIDMIVTPEDRYIFLEVNPKGQYGMTSIPCGYNLDYKIAQNIILNQ